MSDETPAPTSLSPTRLEMTSTIPLEPGLWMKVSAFGGFAGLDPEQRARLEQAVEEAAHLLSKSEGGESGPYAIALVRGESHVQVEMSFEDPARVVPTPDVHGLEWRLLRRLADALRFDEATDERPAMIEFAYVLNNAPKPLSQSLETKVVKEDDVVVLSLNGRLDSLTAPGLEKEFNALLEAGTTQLLIDARGLDYLSSAGLRLFVTVAKALEGKGFFAMLSPTDRIREVLIMAGLEREVPVFTTAQAALASRKSGI